MSFLLFALDLYFAAMFGSSGLAKISNPRSFANILRQQRILPGWSTRIVSLTLPLAEILIALCLVAGLIAIVTATLVLALLLTFLGVKVYLLMTGSTADCGCHGSENPRPVDSASVIASAILALLAAVHLWFSIQVAPVNWPWRLIADCVFLVIGCFLIGKIIVRLRTRPHVSEQIAVSATPLNPTKEQVT